MKVRESQRQDNILEQKKEEAALLEQKEKLRVGLPFLYGWNWYKWAREFYECRNKMAFLCAANQISKSSTQIRTAIDWATNKPQWKELWPHLAQGPKQFWYLYPARDVATAEFETKWNLFLPGPEFKEHPVYGWRARFKAGEIHSIVFNSGVIIYFKTYAQDVKNLQTGTCDAIFCDEELPEELIDELMMRISASDGYFRMVFTATIGQEIWRKTMEPKKDEKENYPDAWKRQISIYDCLHYEDGSVSHWTNEKIRVIIARCKSKAAIQRRVYGRFAIDSGLKYESFDRERNMRPRAADVPLIPFGWSKYGIADVGSGGDGHPGAISFIAVDPTYRRGRIFKCWKGDSENKTTAGDIFLKFIAMRGELVLDGQFYDQGSADFNTIATAAGESFMPSDKDHERGEELLNVLFQNQMLDIEPDDPETDKLATELETLKVDTPKRKAKDDLCDTVRYGCNGIPWDLSVITGMELPGPARNAEDGMDETERFRRGMRSQAEIDEEANTTVEQEMEEWNDLY